MIHFFYSLYMHWGNKANFCILGSCNCPGIGAQGVLASSMKNTPFSLVKKLIEIEDEQWQWNKISAPDKNSENTPKTIMSFKKFTDKYRNLEGGIITMPAFKK